MIRCAALVVCFAAAAVAQSDATGIDFAAARDHVLPDSDENAWRSVAWRASFGTAALEADRDDKPVLLWAMNGHPLGCT